MRNTVEYTFDNYPNVQVLVYKGADDTYETDLDKILSNLADQLGSKAQAKGQK